MPAFVLDRRVPHPAAVDDGDEVMRSMARHPAHRPSTRLPVVTLIPRSVSPVETWVYTLPDARSGVAIGDASWAARYVLNLADPRHWRGVVLRFPKARWGGLRSHDITLRNYLDLPRLRAVDVEAVVWRQGLALPWMGERPSVALVVPWLARAGRVVAGGVAGGAAVFSIAVFAGVWAESASCSLHGNHDYSSPDPRP